MADYKELLRRAIEALAESNGAARRQVYEKARGALVLQLRAIEPPLPAREITQHRLKLEDCIRQVEQEATEALLNSGAPPPPAPTPAGDTAAEEQAEEAIAEALHVEESDAGARSGKPAKAPERAGKPKPAPKAEPPAAREPATPNVISTRKAPPPKPEPEPDPEQEPEAIDTEGGEQSPGKVEAPAEPLAAAGQIEAGDVEAGDVEAGDVEASDVEAGDGVEDEQVEAIDDAETGGLSIEDVIAAAQRDAGDHEAEAPASPIVKPVVKPATRIEQPPRSRGGSAPRPRSKPERSDEDRRVGLEAAIGAAMSSVREVEVDDADARPKIMVEAEDENPQAAIDRAIAALDREVNGATLDEPAGIDIDGKSDKPPAPTAEPSVEHEPGDEDFWSEADAAAFEAGNEEFGRAPMLDGEPSGRGGFTIFLAVVVVLLLAAGGGGWWAWREGYVDFGGLMARLGGAGARQATVSEPAAPDVAASDVSAQTEPQPQNAAPSGNTTQAPGNAALPENGAGLGDEEKIDERLPAEDTVRVVTPQPAGNVAATATPAPAADAAVTIEQPAAGEPPAGTPPVDPALAEGSQSILLEQTGGTENGPAMFSGAVEWSRGVDELGLPVIRARASIPARKLSVNLLFRKNSDEALPASHIFEIDFEVAEGFVGGGIASVPGVLLKNEELAQGRELIGAPARVFDNSFLYALSAEPVDVAANKSLLREQSWLDLPLVYSTGRWAIITLEMGEQGRAIFDAVLDAWDTE